MWRGYQSCGEVTQPSVARLPNLWRDYLWRGYLVARLQSGYRWQSNISLKSATFQLHFCFSSSFSSILHLNCIGKHIGLCFGSWDAEPWLCSNSVLAWASPFNSAGMALSSKILWPTKINLLRQKQRYCSKCGAAIEWCWASLIFCGNPTIRPTPYKSGTGYSLHQAPETPDNTIH